MAVVFACAYESCSSSSDIERPLQANVYAGIHAKLALLYAQPEISGTP